MKRLRIEDRLEAFMLSAVAIAEYKRQVAVEREQQEQKAKEDRENASLVAAQRRQRAQRLFDLDSRVHDCLKAEQIRGFLARVKAWKTEGAEGTGSNPEFAEWISWAESLAGELESEALGTVLDLRRPPEPESASNAHNEFGNIQGHLQGQIDLWQRRYVFGRR